MSHIPPSIAETGINYFKCESMLLVKEDSAHIIISSELNDFFK